jgi:hypothetical protein
MVRILALGEARWLGAIMMLSNDNLSDYASLRKTQNVLVLPQISTPIYRLWHNVKQHIPLAIVHP